MLQDNQRFVNVAVADYHDWGTLSAWNRYKRAFATIFVDLDGVLIQNSAHFSKPYWGTTPALRTNVEALNTLYRSGTVKVIITTSRKRSSAAVTRKQLAREGVLFHDIVFDLPHARRILINDYNSTNPYKSAEAINIARNAPELGHLLATSSPTANFAVGVCWRSDLWAAEMPRVRLGALV